MQGSTQEALLLAIAERDNIFEMFGEMFSSDNYHKVLMSFEEGKQYAEISEDAGVSEGTVAAAFKELEEHGLIERDGEETRQHALPVLKHPVIQYYYWQDVVGDE